VSAFGAAVFLKPQNPLERRSFGAQGRALTLSPLCASAPWRLCVLSFLRHQRVAVIFSQILCGDLLLVHFLTLISRLAALLALPAEKRLAPPTLK
jgi:hypothetical protein